MSKHTPGPWHIESGAHYRAIRTDGEVIANMREIGSVFNEANARLIATSPELLEVLSRVVRDHDSTLGVTLETIDQARAAIAKATGD